MQSFLLRTTTVLLIAVTATAVVAGCTRVRDTVVPTTTPESSVSAVTDATPTLQGTPIVLPTVANNTGVGEPGVTRAAPSASTSSNGTSTAIAAAAAPAQPQQTQYTVRAGDTLDTIAALFNTDPATIRKLNYLQNDNIRAGQILLVPFIPPPPTSTPEPFTYQVQPGDDLSSIAVRFGSDSGKIMEANGITDPNLLRVGQELLIPGYDPNLGVVVEKNEEGTPVATEEGTPTSEDEDVVSHVVQPGEGLYSIAQKYEIDAAKIAEANGISNYNLIRVGQKLVIPGLTPAEFKRLRSIIHTVKSGETLLAIAQQYGVSPEEIAAENELTNPNALVVGQELIIPTAE